MTFIIERERSTSKDTSVIKIFVNIMSVFHRDTSKNVENARSGKEKFLDPDTEVNGSKISFSYPPLHLRLNFHKNPNSSFSVNLLKDKQTDRQTDKETNAE